MSDTPSTSTTPPPAAPLPNAVIPSNFNDLAQQQAAIARSPLERALDAPAQTRDYPNDDLGPTPPGVMDFESRLQASRQRDQQAQGAQATQRQDQQPQPQTAQPADPNAPKPNVEFRSQRQQKNQQQQRRAADWDALKGELETLRAERAQWQGGQVALASGTSNATVDFTKLPIDQLLTNHPELKRLKEERDTFYEEVKHVRVEADPEFRAKFESRRDAAIRVAKSVAGGAGDDVAKIMGLSDGDARRTALAERLASGNFSDSSKTKIAAAVASLDALDVEREMEIASRKATWESTQAARQAHSQASFQQRVDKLDREFNDVAARWADPEKGMPFVLNNKDAVIANARRVFSGETDAAALAEAALKAAVLPDVIKGWEGAVNEVMRLQEQLARYTGVYPGDDTGASHAPAPQNAINVPADLYNAQHVASFDQRLQAARMADAQRGFGR